MTSRPLLAIRFPPYGQNLELRNWYIIFYLAILKMLTINMDSANVTCTTANLPRQMLTAKLFTMHLAMIGFRKLRVV